MGAVVGQQVGSGRAAALGALSPEDQVRADVYTLLGQLVSSAPDAAMLRALSVLEGDQSALGRAFLGLAEAARATTAEQAHEAHFDLFVGVGRGELVPFASYYLTGFLQEKPLARLRVDITRLGLMVDPANREPEDHAGQVLRMMAHVILGRMRADAVEAPEADGRIEIENAFYSTHVGSWMGVFFRDVAAAKASPFYAAVGEVGRQFLLVEDRLFEMTAATSRAAAPGRSVGGWTS